ncbi:MAG: Na+/H+ antiporter NhaA, partial [Candidatus Thorarchaeota archaeon]
MRTTLRGRSYPKKLPSQILKRANPLMEFMRLEAAGGLILVVCILVALAWANSPLSQLYEDVWSTQLVLSFNGVSIGGSTRFWTTDFLMFIFFLFVGLEIKRELLVGELIDRKTAVQPVIAAIGGVLAPAALYSAFNPPGTLGARGWPIPTATDVAIVLGVLSIHGRRVPSSLKVFMAVLAIADDFMGVLILTAFYTVAIRLDLLAIAMSIIASLAVLNILGVRNYLPYVVGAIATWICFVETGIHPTVAGVLIAATIPASTRIDLREFTVLAQELVRDVGDRLDDENEIDAARVYESVKAIETVCREAQAPLQRVQSTLSRWVAFVVVPLFILSNTGVRVVDYQAPQGTVPIAVGIILGLVVGKPLGITMPVLIMDRSGLLRLPRNVTWGMMLGAACLGGIAMTISTLFASLTFPDPRTMQFAEESVMIGS